jgi:hypothetical protein
LVKCGECGTSFCSNRRYVGKLLVTGKRASTTGPRTSAFPAPPGQCTLASKNSAGVRLRRLREKAEELRIVAANMRLPSLTAQDGRRLRRPSKMLSPVCALARPS